MVEITDINAHHKDRSLILILIGVLLLLVGVAAALLGPAEMYCFYFFIEGGRFHYEGFGFGSFMFGNMACQIIGYYLIAIVAISLGYGHVTRRRWARTLSMTLLWFWLVVGVPLTIVFLFILVTAKDLSLVAVLISIVALGASYLVLPGLLIRFYRSRDVRLTFETADGRHPRDPRSYRIEELPLPILVLCALYSFYTIVLHVPIFFNGIFPLFGDFVYELPGILMLDASIMLLVCLIWGTWRRSTWAWWGGLVYFGLLTSSSILTFAKSDYLDILSMMKFAPLEMKALQGLPFQGFYFAVFFGVPLLITLGLIVASKRHFKVR